MVNEYQQPELFIPDPDVPGRLTANPDAIVLTTPAGRAFAMARIAAQNTVLHEPLANPRDAERIREQELLDTLRFEHDDNNPNRPPDPDDLARIRQTFAPKPKRPTIARQNASERAYIARTRRQFPKSRR